MSYHIYTTKGIILSERPVGEADRIYNILTRDLGLVRAKALSVRKAPSKLRGSLEPVVLSSVSLVRGKEYWRLTAAEELRSIPSRVEIVRPLSLLEKLVQGEDPHPELFDAIDTKIQLQDGLEDDFEVRLVSQILFHLGYLKEEDLNLDKKALIKAINNGLSATMLT